MKPSTSRDLFFVSIRKLIIGSIQGRFTHSKSTIKSIHLTSERLQRAACGCTDGTVQIFDTITNKFMGTIDADLVHKSSNNYEILGSLACSNGPFFIFVPRIVFSSIF